MTRYLAIILSFAGMMLGQRRAVSGERQYPNRRMGGSLYLKAESRVLDRHRIP